MKTLPIVTCGHCCGTGKIKLPKQLLRTLNRIRKSKKPLTSLDLAEDGLVPSAINNRLTALHEFGLIQQVGKKGKCFLWSAQGNKAESPNQ